MSSISAGTTTGTALVSTGDTTGQLVLKTNGTTTAVTIGTDQVVTLAQALPAASGGTGLTSPGTSGNVLTSNGSAWVSSTPTSIGGGGTTTTDNVTLTSSSAADQYVTPSGYGYYVTLPDATTLSEGSGLFNIHNNSNFFYAIRNSAGTTLCFVPAYKSVTCSLADNSTAAGTWNFVNQQQLGTTIQSVLALPSSTGASLLGMKVVNLDSRYQVLVFNTDANLYGVVYDNTNNTFGSVTLIRTVTMASASSFITVKVSTTSLLVCSCSNTTALEAVLLSVSGTTITVNTAATATLAGNMNFFNDVQVCGSSYVISYRRATNVPAVRAFTVSGTTVTIGSESTLSGTTVTGIFKTSASTFLAASFGSTTIYVKPYSVSGSTLTAGTEATTTASVGADGIYLNSNNNLMFCSYTGGYWKGYVASVSGTTASISSVNLVANGATASTFDTLNGALYVGNQILYMFYQGTLVSGGAQYVLGFNVLTDSSGTAAAGTEIVTPQVTTPTSGPLAYMAGRSGTKMFVTCSPTGDNTAMQVYITAGISGNNPVISSSLYYYTYGYGMNTSGGTVPRVLWNTQRGEGYSSCVGNAAKGDFMSLTAYANGIHAAAPTAYRFNENSLSTTPYSSARLSAAPSDITGGTPSLTATASNTYSDSTTLNQYGDVWGLAAVQATAVGSFSYSKVVISRLVYA